MNQEKIEVRTLFEIEWKKFREIRLESLQIDGGFFTSSHEIENKFFSGYWQEIVKETPEKCVIGLFVCSSLIGISIVSEWDGDATGRTALFSSSYVKEEFRGNGFAKILYRERLEWARTKSRYDFAVVSHRVGNKRSEKLNKDSGANYIYSSSRVYGDGETDTGLWYLLKLNDN